MIYLFFFMKIQKTKKIKSIFINDNDSFLIDCYELDNNSKVKILNKFLSDKSLKMDHKDVLVFN